MPIADGTGGVAMAAMVWDSLIKTAPYRKKDWDFCGKTQKFKGKSLFAKGRAVLHKGCGKVCGKCGKLTSAPTGE
jgi:hypothetical protein